MNTKPHQALSHRGFPCIAALLLLGFAPVPLIAEDAWPMWRRDTRGGPVPGEPELNNPQITEETRLWISEADIPPGRRGSHDDGRGMDGLLDMERPLTGGFASPIAADGKIFHFFYRPSGTVYDSQRARALGIDTTGRPLPEKDDLSREEALDRILAGEVGDMDLLMETGFGEEEEKEEPEFQVPKIEGNLVRGNERWLVAATDILLAIDQETGKTVWQTELTDQGLNYGFFGKGASGITPVYHDGMVIALGTSAKVFGVDAQTGEVRWTYKLQPRHERHMTYLRDALEGRSMAARFNRDMLVALVAAEGIVVINDQRWHRVSVTGGTTYHYDTPNSYVALDVRTGEELWVAPEVGSGGTTPKLWRHGDKTYVLAIRGHNLTLLDLATGEQIWESDYGHSSPTAAFNLGIGEHHVVMAAGREGESGRKLSGFAIDLEGLRKLWTWGPIDEFRSNALIVGDTGYMHVNEHLRAFNTTTGETLREVHVGNIRPAGGNPLIAYYGGWIFSRSRDLEGNGHDGFLVLKADPKHMEESKRFFEARTAQPYFVLLFPAFANNKIFFRTDDTYKIEAYRLD
ncbi:MAG: PQQ-binding-like beta-propeller repeat protein [Verrucomicrobia bacterium]|nr:PQQ-binding-like beta-propeller repeat protein [Verrucomicrobiota bacterium]MCH8514571.1 PQQ-like beta-propeller repeat protein [Kiritimatiellia bacterium]